MREFIRSYNYFIIGAVGGLTGWFLATLLLRSLGEAVFTDRQGYGHQALYGAMLGALIGLSIAAYDGIVNRSLQRFIRFGAIGLGIGIVAGALALAAAQWLYGSLIGSAGQSVSQVWKFLIGTFCWVVFGGLIGLGEGGSKGTQSWKGLLGGVIGGVFGGLFYEIKREPDNSMNANPWVLAVSFLLLGGIISVSIAFVTSALREAWFDVIQGKASGPIEITKYVHPQSRQAGTIGSDPWRSHVYLPGDNRVLPRHAEISFSNGAPTLTVLAEANKIGATFLNGRRVTASPLSDGDRLQIGSTTLVYHQKRK